MAFGSNLWADIGEYLGFDTDYIRNNSSAAKAEQAAVRAFNREQMSADKAMAFEAQQAELNRAFQQASADKSMAFTAQQAQDAMNFEAEQAKINRDFQLEMSNTAVQRAMSDMKSAGINPILAAGQAASTPSGSAASGFMGSGSSAGGSSAKGAYAAGHKAGVENVRNKFSEVLNLMAHVVETVYSTSQGYNKGFNAGWSARRR